MEVDGIISARSKKNTVNESRMEMDKDTCKKNLKNLIHQSFTNFLHEQNISKNYENGTYLGRDSLQTYIQTDAVTDIYKNGS